MNRAALLFLLTLVLIAGCAGRRSSSADDGQSSRRMSDVITREEIVASGLTDMEEVIQRLRPQFLRTRGRSSILIQSSDQIAVYLDGVLMGTVATLRNIDAAVVERVEWIGGSDTGIKVGRSHPAGVIQVITRRGTPGSDADAPRPTLPPAQ